MRDYIRIGSSPTEESCAQVGSENYTVNAKKECIAFKNQLQRLFPNVPDGCYFSIKSFPHDFGNYYEVVCNYDDCIDESMEFAFKVEGNTPSYWDDEAKKELGINV